MEGAHLREYAIELLQFSKIVNQHHEIAIMRSAKLCLNSAFITTVIVTSGRDARAEQQNNGGTRLSPPWLVSPAGGTFCGGKLNFY